MNKTDGNRDYGVLVLLFMGFIIIGWVMNLVKLFGCDSTGCAAARLFGAFAFPVGGFMGWF